MTVRSALRARMAGAWPGMWSFPATTSPGACMGPAHSPRFAWRQCWGSDAALRGGGNWTLRDVWELGVELVIELVDGTWSEATMGYAEFRGLNLARPLSQGIMCLVTTTKSTFLEGIQVRFHDLGALHFLWLKDSPLWSFSSVFLTIQCAAPVPSPSKGLLWSPHIIVLLPPPSVIFVWG